MGNSWAFIFCSTTNKDSFCSASTSLLISSNIWFYLDRLVQIIMTITPTFSNDRTFLRASCGTCANQVRYLSDVLSRFRIYSDHYSRRFGRSYIRKYVIWVAFLDMWCLIANEKTRLFVGRQCLFLPFLLQFEKFQFPAVLWIINNQSYLWLFEIKHWFLGSNWCCSLS